MIKFKLLPPPDGDDKRELMFRCLKCEKEVTANELARHSTSHGTSGFTVDTIPSYDLDTTTGRSTYDDWNRD